MVSDLVEGDVVMLLLEIGLSIAAWKRGWHIRALMPRVMSLTVGFFLGMFILAGAATTEAMRPVAALGDVSALVALVVMAFRVPDSARREQALAEETA